MPEGSVVCAKEPFCRGSKAAITQFTDGYAIPSEVRAAGYKYFLKGSGIEQLLEMIERKACSREARAEFVIHYAMSDAYPSWSNDLPDKQLCFLEQYASHRKAQARGAGA